MAKTKTRDEAAGNEPSSPTFGPDELKEAEKTSTGRPASASSNSTTGGKVGYNSGKPKKTESSDSTNSTAPGKTTLSSDEPEASLYKSATASQTSKGRLSFSGFGLTKRRAIFGGGGIAGGVIALLLLTIGSGPLEFIHIAKLMEQFHFSALQDGQDNRFSKEVRYIRFARNGQVERTRLGFFGNKFADTFEAKLNASGFTSAYTDKFGLFNGYVLDRNNEKFKNFKSDDEIRKFVKEEYGLDAVEGKGKLNGELVIDASKLGFFKTKALNRTVLTQAGYSKVSASVGARLLCKRADCTLHPLKILKNKSKAALEEWLTGRDEAIGEGQSVEAEAAGTPDDPNNPDPDARAGEAAAAEAVGETSTGAKGAAKTKASLEAFKGSIHSRLAAGAAAAVGVLCMVKGVNDHADDIKQTQVILPLIRTGTEALSVGSQIESGQDVDTDELGQLSKQLNGVDSAGNKTSWDQAESIQANLGKSDTGVKPSSTLTSAGQSGKPFPWLSSFNFILGPACGAIGSALTGALSIVFDFTGIGALVASLTGQAVLQIVQGPILDQIAHWLAGQAVDPEAVGADYGSNIDFGSRLAANDQAMASGGRKLSGQEETQLADFESNQAEQDFQHHNIAYKLFDTYDQRSAISKLIDNSSTSPTDNVASFAKAGLGFGKTLSVLPHLLMGSAKAATAGSFDYGFPAFGFSDSEMDNPAVENPYQNADDVAALLDKTGNTYIDRAKKCFGVTIAQVTSGTDMQWNVTSAQGDSPKYADIPDSCSDDKDTNWLKVRFFIMDTEVMNGMACYQGVDSDPDVTQACTDIGQTAAPAGP